LYLIIQPGVKILTSCAENSKIVVMNVGNF